MTILFKVPGEPVAKGRARSFIRAGHVAHYTPDKTAKYENLVKLVAQMAMHDDRIKLIESAVSLTVTAYMGIPQSWSEKKKLAAKKSEILPTKRPDLDNIVKAIKDGMNGVVFKDDSQVIEIRARKLYGENPCVMVEVNFDK